MKNFLNLNIFLVKSQYDPEQFTPEYELNVPILRSLLQPRVHIFTETRFADSVTNYSRFSQQTLYFQGLKY